MVYSAPFPKHKAPPKRFDGVSKRLTPKAARTIQGAALKAEQLGTPLVTFATFTLDDPAQARVAAGELTAGREMTRVLKAWRERCRRRGVAAPEYAWVAENPESKRPSGNLHIHLLTSYSVPRSEFAEFVAWLEAVWGHGWVKVERIKVPRAAGRYLLKAVSYSVKGADENQEQGRVHGRRWSVSAAIRPAEQRERHPDSDGAALRLESLAAHARETGKTLRAEGLAVTPRGIFCTPSIALDYSEFTSRLDRIAATLQPEPF